MRLDKLPGDGTTECVYAPWSTICNGPFCDWCKKQRKLLADDPTALRAWIAAEAVNQMARPVARWCECGDGFFTEALYEQHREWVHDSTDGEHQDYLDRHPDQVDHE